MRVRVFGGDLQQLLGDLEGVEGAAVGEHQLHQRAHRVEVRGIGVDLPLQLLGPGHELGRKRSLAAEVRLAAALRHLLLGLRIGPGVRLRPDDQRGDQADHAAAEQDAGEQGVRLDEGAAGRRAGFRPDVAFRSDAGDRLLDLVEFLQHARRRDLEPLAVGRFQAGLLQPGDQVLAAIHEVGALQLERGGARRGFPGQEGEADSQAGENGGDDGDRRDDSQVAVSCSTCRRYVSRPSSALRRRCRSRRATSSPPTRTMAAGAAQTIRLSPRARGSSSTNSP